MSITFENEIPAEAAELIKSKFDVMAMDKKTALLKRMGAINARDMSDIARAAKQPAKLEINAIGDRKEVGGVIYELDEKGWRRLPIGTTLDGAGGKAKC